MEHKEPYIANSHETRKTCVRNMNAVYKDTPVSEDCEPDGDANKNETDFSAEQKVNGIHKGVVLSFYHIYSASLGGKWLGVGVLSLGMGTFFKDVQLVFAHVPKYVLVQAWKKLIISEGHSGKISHAYLKFIRVELVLLLNIYKGCEPSKFHKKIHFFQPWCLCIPLCNLKTFRLCWNYN